MTDPQQDPTGNDDAPDIGFSLGDLRAAPSPEAQPSGMTDTTATELAQGAAEAEIAADADVAAPAPEATEEQAAEGQPATDQPTAGKSTTDQPIADESIADQRTEDQAFEEQPSGDQSIGHQAAEEQAIEDQTAELEQRIASELAETGPEGWRRLEAVFALTVVGGVADVLYYDDADRADPADPTETVSELVRQHRELSAELGDGPWWRMLVRLDVAGELEIEVDYGDEPFPDDQLLPPEAYEADLEVFPRERIPVWLAAYLFHDDQQRRTPREAAAQARADRDFNITAEVSRDDFPALPVLWARWATIAAAFVAVESEWGPRITPAVGIFEGAARSGSTLHLLPGGRAVLSGGMWNSPELDAAYNDDEPLPDVYSGAPEWVADPVLNSRAARGMLSFCYWWDRGTWRRGESPGAEEISAAVPGVWTAQIVADIVCGLVSDDPSEELREAAATLVAAAEAGVVTRNTLAAMFDNPADDIDGALYQLSLAGLTSADPDALPRDRAISLVRDYILDLGVDTTGYPLDQLVAERLEVGWMVFVPTQPGEIAIGRAIFYIADDEVIERSSSSTAPSQYTEGFEQRFHQRQTTVGADFAV